MKRVKIILLLFLFAGCAQLTQIAEQTMNSGRPLTQNEIIAGLKEA